MIEHFQVDAAQDLSGAYRAAIESEQAALAALRLNTVCPACWDEGHRGTVCPELTATGVGA